MARRRAGGRSGSVLCPPWPYQAKGLNREARRLRGWPERREDGEEPAAARRWPVRQLPLRLRRVRRVGCKAEALRGLQGSRGARRGRPLRPVITPVVPVGDGRGSDLRWWRQWGEIQQVTRAGLGEAWEACAEGRTGPGRPRGLLLWQEMEAPAGVCGMSSAPAQPPATVAPPSKNTVLWCGAHPSCGGTFREEMPLRLVAEA